jgi:RluA family pseudouridine synthase
LNTNLFRDPVPMSAVTNISCYRFAPLKDLKPLRERLVRLCSDWGLRGTILLSTEGINLFVAGRRERVDDLVTEIRSISGLEALDPKYSVSDDQPFTRMLVRIKKEIIAFGVDGIEPALRTSPKLAPATLKQWLDEGRPLTLLDTRNDYEVKLGTFEGALDLKIENFRRFPDAVAALPEEMKETPIVMFCTGGIRCEKAGPFMERAGFRQVFQLDGGILKYFEECGGSHYRGECFVFDHRVGVDSALHETDSTQCYVCQSPLTPAEQADPRYVASESCPYCYKSTEEKMQISIAGREAAIREISDPLPGSIPYDNTRPLLIPGSFDGRTLLAFLCGVFPHHALEKWEGLCRAERFHNRNGSPVGADQVVRSGERYTFLMPGIVEPDVSAAIRILYEDEAVIVVDKPAPLPMHPSGRFNKNTLQYFLSHAYAPQHPRPAHRLDANTSGVVVWTRTRHFSKLVHPQFSGEGTEKVYLARIHGHPKEDVFSSTAPISREPGVIGSRQVDMDDGLDARTDFRVIHRQADGTALLEARPKTGRTNQIRIHLWQLGLPVCGDPAYLAGGKIGPAMTLEPGQPPLCLHSWKISFQHPLTKERKSFEAPAPSWAKSEPDTRRDG